MPVVMRLDFGGIKVSIYLKDHNPPHVHCRGGGCEATFEIETMALVHNNGFDQKTLRRIAALLAPRQQYLRSKWDEYFDDEDAD